MVGNEDAISSPRKRDKNEVIALIHEIHPNIEIIGEYKDTNAPLLVRCCLCGNEWESRAQRLLRGSGCRVCATKRRTALYPHPKRKTHDEFVRQMHDVNPNIEILTPYINARSKVGCRCLICRNEWTAKPSNLESGFGCPLCGVASVKSKQLKSIDVFIQQLNDVNPDINLLGEYTGNRENVHVGCKLCRREWNAMPLNLLKKDGKATGCPYCKRSHGEKYIESWLVKHGVNYIAQKTFQDLRGVGGCLLSYDFYLPTLNMLIEYQGEFHDHTAYPVTDDEFARTVEHDRRKQEYANNNGYIYYPIWYYDDKEEKLNKLISIT